MTRILFLTPGHEDYLADGLLHGLRTLLGADVVDFPKAEFLYDSYPLERRGELYGRGFSLYGLLPDTATDRNRVFERARTGEFDLIVFADIWSTFGVFSELAPTISGTPMAVLDGADRQEPYPYAGLWWRKPAWWTLPRAHTRATYFKRELTPVTGWFRSYLLLPPALASRLPSIRKMRETSFSFPAEKILRESSAEKRRLLASHVVDPEVQALVPGVGDQLRVRRRGRRTTPTCAARASGSRPSATGGTRCATTSRRRPAACRAFAICTASRPRAPRTGSTRPTASPTRTRTRCSPGSRRWARTSTPRCGAGRSSGRAPIRR